MANPSRAAMPEATNPGSDRVHLSTSGWMPPHTATYVRSVSTSFGSPVRRTYRTGPASYMLSQLGASDPPPLPRYWANDPNHPSSSSRTTTSPRGEVVDSTVSRSTVVSMTANPPVSGGVEFGVVRLHLRSEA